MYVLMQLQARILTNAITHPHNNNNNLCFSSLGHHFLSITGDKFHSDTIESAFKELHSEVDAVFSYEGHLYMIKVLLCCSFYQALLQVYFNLL